MASRINLNEPFLEQIQRQAIRETLDLPLELSPAKSNFEEMLRVVRDAICKELADAKYDESELLGLRLEYRLIPKESDRSEEIYSVEWCQPFQGTGSRNKNLMSATTTVETANIGEENPKNSEDVSSRKLPVSVDFLETLAQRFDEAVVNLVPGSTGSAISWSFRSAPIEFLGRSCTCVGSNGKRYERLPDGTCSDYMCEIRIDRPKEV
ncbi:hypothetical protein WA1_10275 [Scytonema hofmannii PCC 7110]|uniref:Uncharacterized protein n=1 Tax=Scytonema hofmannii PCC 7110 TaxID=128403 RepID=A0A139WRP7_9CYAN|nr:hypothetical protein [Scytonema hofmannii]KYC35103.1 hypothetical protein WA1_10275 [Scytonema hofmannii PCC 7110]